jgi:hypothetical protein
MAVATSAAATSVKKQGQQQQQGQLQQLRLLARFVAPLLQHALCTQKTRRTQRIIQSVSQP